MKQEQIENMIDKKIENKFSCGSLPSQVVNELITMTNNISKVLARENVSLSDYVGVEWDSIDKARVKYAIHYIKHCNRRISDMTWVKSKKGVLSINYWEIWRLFKFREMMLSTKSKKNILEVFKKQIEKTKPLDEEALSKYGEKKWSSGKDIKVGQVHLRAFILNGSQFHKVINLPLEELELYDVDEKQCEKIGYDKLYVPYLTLKKTKVIVIDDNDDIDKVVGFKQFD